MLLFNTNLSSNNIKVIFYNNICTVPYPGVDQKSKSAHGGIPQGIQGRKVNRSTARDVVLK